MAIVDELEQLHHLLGRSIILPTPPACQELIEQARASGISIGTLYVLCRPLAAGMRGSYDRKSGDLWCHYDSGDEQGAREVLQCVLTFIAYARLQLPPPTTLEEDWEQAQAAHKEAFTLAQTWNRDDLFSAADLSAFLSIDDHLYQCHIAAAELAGSLNPSIARNAYLALSHIRGQQQWSDTAFEAALNGIYEGDEEANAVVLDFDRTTLRSRWLLTSTRRQDAHPSPFGVFTLPQPPRTASILRSLLAKITYQRVENAASQMPLQAPERPRLSFFHVLGEEDLYIVMKQANAWLIDVLPERYARVEWRFYADVALDASTPSAHLYHLSVAYECHDNEKERHRPEESESTERHLWVLFPACRRRETIEAAWQRYIRSWLAFQQLHCDSLYYGLQMLWSWLKKEA